MRITTEETSGTVRFLLEGKLSGPWVAEFERVLVATKAFTDKMIVLDISGLSGADAAGRHLLVRLQSGGAVLENADPLSASLLCSTIGAEFEVVHTAANFKN